MTMFDPVLQRLERLERQNRQLKFAGLLGLVLCISLLVMGQAKAPETIAARRFVLVDEAGKVRAELNVRDAGPYLVLLDENGEPSAGLGAWNDGGTETKVEKGGKGTIDICRCLTEPGNTEWSRTYGKVCNQAISSAIGVVNWREVNFSKSPILRARFDSLAAACGQ